MQAAQSTRGPHADASPLDGTAPGGGAAEMTQTLYVWDLPVRITHWTNVAMIVVLSITGYYISNPLILTHGPAVDQFLMGTVRFIHFVAAFVFAVSVLFRVYWAFMSRIKYARWSQFVPVSAGRLRALGRMLGYYTFLRRRPPAEIGHNPLAGVTYVGLYVLFTIQIVTGFALYSLPFHGGFWPVTFGWIVTVFGETVVRWVHDVLMFLIMAFTIHHVYSAILIDIEERSGLVSSMVTGSKSLTPSHIAEAQREDMPATRGGHARRVREGEVRSDA
jgi:Ni/Fe-hydrogenase 1 B-type cytochrome subunit